MIRIVRQNSDASTTETTKKADKRKRRPPTRFDPSQEEQRQADNLRLRRIWLKALQQWRVEEAERTYQKQLKEALQHYLTNYCPHFGHVNPDIQSFIEDPMSIQWMKWNVKYGEETVIKDTVIQPPHPIPKTLAQKVALKAINWIIIIMVGFRFYLM